MISFENCITDHGTPPPAPAPNNMHIGGGAPPPPEFPPRGSSFNHPSLMALQQGQQQQRAATLVVTKDNDEPPTYEVIPYSTGRWLHAIPSIFIKKDKKHLLLKKVKVKPSRLPHDDE